MNFIVSLVVSLVAGSIAAGIIMGIIWLFICAPFIVQFLALVIVLFLIFLYSNSNKEEQYGGYTYIYLEYITYHLLC